SGKRARWVTAVAVIAFVGCGSGKSTGGGGNSGSAGGGGSGASGFLGNAGCSDLFAQDVVRTYALDISPPEWNAIMAEFNDMGQLLQNGNDFASRHPVT